MPDEPAPLGEVVDEGGGSARDTSARVGVEWWRGVDRNLRGIARRRVVLDGDEAHWLREAERVQIWKPLGMVSMWTRRACTWMRMLRSRS